MKTYTCDWCGHAEHDKRGIVGKEFEYSGFQTLAESFRWGDVVDVCKPCFKKIAEATAAARKDSEINVRLGFLSRLGISSK